MGVNEMLRIWDTDTRHREQMAFASLFILGNRMQTACERIQTETTMKQWLLLVIAGQCPAPRTLSRVGALMGCSRQNVKQLACALERRGLVLLEHGPGNALCVEVTDAARDYLHRVDSRQARALQLLFDDFSDEEVSALYRAVEKLFRGTERMERYAARLD